ncbi:hypothetical protein DLAC_02335 [Tieghemostelium lacteum]|uniref:Uncharacterized protein n=1 Tax=Tieghemostelium lacteum TaxID=361077 RepID=A0A152A560_TIELA|nr:hypothetical protein DLAC_02335 [Tieghemostelium lacteum]|eukprot:KYR01217.1 hypothetical protein DLAC_02335 [Tieghemostelium lacteum]
MDLASFEQRAIKAELIIEELSKRVEALENSLLNSTHKYEDKSSETISKDTYKALVKENEDLKKTLEKQEYRIKHLVANLK